MKKLLLVTLHHSNVVSPDRIDDALEHKTYSVHEVGNLTPKQIYEFADDLARDYYGAENFTEANDSRSYFFHGMACCVSVENYDYITQTEYEFLKEYNIVEEISNNVL
jgi:hypothetical protein